MQSKLFKQYVELEEEFRLLEEKKAILREAILEDMRESKVEKVETELGSFTVVHKTSWQYSPKVIGMEERLKIAKYKEQEKGLAKAKISDSLRFTKPNPLT